MGDTDDGAADPGLLEAVGDLVRLATGRSDLLVRAEQTFVDDLGVDSLRMLEVLEGCRTRFGTRVTEDAARQLVHVGDLVDYLEHHVEQHRR